MSLRPFVVLPTILFLLPFGMPWPGIVGAAAETAGTAETRAEVPELTAFHEVIAQLWHGAWPAKDYTQMKDLLARVEQGVASVEGASLPGILRDKQAAWDGQLAALRTTLERYRAAVVSDDDEALADAVEALHARFESMVRLIHPALPELDAYHVVLYRIYHYLAPGRDLPGVRAAAEDLSGRCGDLRAAPVPKRYEASGERLATEVAALCERTERLRQAAAGEIWDPVEPTIGEVHSQYLIVAGLFE